MNLRLVRGLGLLAAVLFLTGCFTDDLERRTGRVVVANVH